MCLTKVFTFILLLAAVQAFSFPALSLSSLPVSLPSISDPLSSPTGMTSATDASSLEEIADPIDTSMIKRTLDLGLESVPASLSSASDPPSVPEASPLKESSPLTTVPLLTDASSLWGGSIIKRALGLDSLPLSFSTITSPLSSLTSNTLPDTSIIKRALGLAALPLSLSSISSPLSAVTGGGSIFRRQSACPSVWFQISAELTELFVTDTQCNDAARAAIRIAFHDCFPGGGCDGSLALTEELNRSENVPIIPDVKRLVDIADKYGVSKADMFVFAGNHAVASCPLGPRTRTFIGRVDTQNLAPTGQVPLADISAQQALSEFKARGFTAKDLAALLGAHTTARQFTTDPSVAGRSLDSTPGIWDVLYYAQTLLGIAPFTLASDARLARNSETGFWFTFFSVNQLGWNDAFASAMLKMTLLGSPSVRAMADCTAALPI